jgi:hypothetical protein
MPFQKGHKLARGGARPGAGQPEKAFREMCQGIVTKKMLADRLTKIATGEDIDQPLSNGEIVPLPAPVSEQRKAILDLLDRAYGKPIQPTVEVEKEDAPIYGEFGPKALGQLQAVNKGNPR